MQNMEQVAVIEIKGEIKKVRFILKTLEKFRKNKGVKAVVIRINSPGGAVAPSQEIYESILKLRKAGKKVVASMGTVAASGGYYIACACDKIVANPGTITGSIGVIFMHFDISAVITKLGIKVNPVKSSSHKDIMSPYRPMDEEERKILQETVLDVYDQFLGAVSKGRNLTKEQIKPYADGRIFSGRQAKKLDLVDELGGLEHAINLAKKIAKLKKSIPVKRYKRPRKFWWDVNEMDEKLQNLTRPRFEILYRVY